MPIENDCLVYIMATHFNACDRYTYFILMIICSNFLFIAAPFQFIGRLTWRSSSRIFWFYLLFCEQNVYLWISMPCLCHRAIDVWLHQMNHFTWNLLQTQNSSWRAQRCDLIYAFHYCFRFLAFFEDFNISSLQFALDLEFCSL